VTQREWRIIVRSRIRPIQWGWYSWVYDFDRRLNAIFL